MCVGVHVCRGEWVCMYVGVGVHVWDVYERWVGTHVCVCVCN